jgi:hypothetical protein
VNDFFFAAGRTLRLGHVQHHVDKSLCTVLAAILMSIKLSMMTDVNLKSDEKMNGPIPELCPYTDVLVLD